MEHFQVCTASVTRPRTKARRFYRAALKGILVVPLTCALACGGDDGGTGPGSENTVTAVIDAAETATLSCEGEVTVHYSGEQSTGVIETWEWRADGQVIGSHPTLDRVFTTNGQEETTLRVTGPDDASDADTHLVRVFAAENCGPVERLRPGFFSFYVGNEHPNPNGLFFSGTHWFVSGPAADRVSRYDSDGNFIDQWDPAAACTGIDGVDGDATRIFVVCGAQDKIYINLHDGTPVDSVDISDGPTEGFGLAFTGSHYIVGDIQGPQFVYVYRADDKSLESTLTLETISSINDLDYDPDNGWLIVYDPVVPGSPDIIRFFDFATGELLNFFPYIEDVPGSFGRAGIWIDDQSPLNFYIVEDASDTVRQWIITLK